LFLSKNELEMKICIIGGTGTIGKKVSEHLSKEHEVIIATRSSVEFPVDIAQVDSLNQLWSKIGPLDAIVNISGEAKWAPFDDLSEDDYYIGIRSKLMGQVNIVRTGINNLNSNGSITLTTGILAEDPVPMTTSAAMVNGGIQSFAQAVALELKDGKRVNVVSAGLVEDAFEKYKNYFPGHHPVTMLEVSRAYERSVLSRDNGRIYRVF